MGELRNNNSNETGGRMDTATTGAFSVANFLRGRKTAILRVWEERVVSEKREVELEGLVLRDDVPALLDELATWLGSDVEPEASPVAVHAAAHVVQRLDQGMPLAQLLREYRLLRETLIAEVLHAEMSEQQRIGHSGDANREARIAELARLNAGLDVFLSQSVLEFVHERDRRMDLERENASRTVRDAQQRLRDELDAMTRLQKVGSLYLRRDNLEPVLAELVDAAIAISGADFGNIQVIAPGSGRLEIAAQRGLPPWWLDFWNHAQSATGACGTAFGRGERIIVEDVEESPIFAGTPALQIQLRAGIRAVQSTPLMSRSGKPLGVLSTHFAKPGRPPDRILPLLDLLARHAADIIERASFESALRSSEERFRALVTASSDVVYRMSPDWSEMRQLRGQGFLADTAAPSRAWLDEYVHPTDQPYVMAVLREAIRNKDMFKLEHRVLRSDGSVRWMFSRAVPLMDERGEIYEWFGAATDISDRKRAEEELHEADRRKNAFLGALSHELRNPLAPVTNSLYILEHAAPGGEQALRAQAVIRRQISHLGRLVDDLLDATRITRNKIHLQRRHLDLGDLVRQTVDDYRSQFENAGIRLDLESAPSPVPVDADASRLAQVMGNLLQNAAKFTSAGGRTEVVLAADAATLRATVKVTDTGIGMEPEVIARLFEPFMQADTSLDRGRGGLGLGLALVKGLVELHGGKVSVHSNGRDQGTQIAVDLPLCTAEHHRSSEGTAATGLLGPRRVLVIEDQVDAADSLRQAFMLGGHATEVAYDGTQGLAKARAFRPEIIFCDIGLPGLSGYEVARAVRADAQLEGTYLIALSGYALPEDLERAADAGFDLHLAKPASLSRLDELLRTVPRSATAT